jgi:hypothetical protein
MDKKAFIGWTTALLLSAGTITATFAAEPAGEEWEYQGRMEMMGMKMPMPVTKRCEKPGQDQTPPVQDNCTVSDIHTQGNTTSFKIHCGAPEPMDGSGTTTRSSDRLEASYTMKTDEAEMVYSMTGKKLGACAP